jgi:SP family galactose:H+ symporter-like MFS transporter
MAFDPKKPVAKASVGYMIMVAALSALSGLLFGYDTGVISGALLLIKKQFVLTPQDQERIVSSVLYGAVIGTGVSGWLGEKFGRKNIIIVAAFIFALGGLYSAFAPDASSLIWGRVFLGIAVGVAACIAPLYISEASPDKMRGSMVFLFQLAITIGILAANLVDLTFVGVTEGWRWMVGLSVVPAVILWAGMIGMPESPRWLISKNRVDEARKILVRLRGTNAVEQEVSDIQSSFKEQQHEKISWTALFAPRLRMPLIIGLGLAVFQQITGINTVIYYAPTILESAGFNSTSLSILSSVGVTLVNVLATIVSVLLVDRCGRRPLLLVGLVGMTISMALMGFVFQSAGHLAPAMKIAAVGSLMLYVASFAISLGPLFFLIVSEIYPLSIRSKASSTMNVVLWSGNILVSNTFLTLAQSVGFSTSFWLFGLLSAAGWLFSFFLVPETKGRSLEEIEASWLKNDESHSESSLATPAGVR